jgi:hypothetical protein
VVCFEEVKVVGEREGEERMVRRGKRRVRRWKEMRKVWGRERKVWQ